MIIQMRKKWARGRIGTKREIGVRFAVTDTGDKIVGRCRGDGSDCRHCRDGHIESRRKEEKLVYVCSVKKKNLVIEW